MITIEADFNHRDEQGRLLLGDLTMHRSTPFASMAEKAREVTFIDGEDAVTGSLEWMPREDGLAQWTGRPSRWSKADPRGPT